RRRHDPQRLGHENEALPARRRRARRRAPHRQPARRDHPGGPADPARGQAAEAVTAPAPRVLILTASYGSGHTGVAETLARKLRAAGAVATVVDHFRELVHPRFDEWSRGLYYWILKEAPALWGGAYWIGDRLSVSSPLLLGFNRIGARKLRRLLGTEGFDHVVSVHPVPAAALSYLHGRGGPVRPHTPLSTDFVAHPRWIHPHGARYCVPAEEIARELMAKELPREGVSVTGIPVARDFSQPADRAAARL